MTMVKRKNGGHGCNKMASFAVMAGGALINALSFSGTNFIFGKLGDHGKEEMKRHNLAMERLSKAREDYTKARQKRLEYINKTMQQQHHAQQNFRNLDQAMEQYYAVTGYKLSPIKEPLKSDYILQSDDHKEVEIGFIVVGMTLIGGVIVYKWG